MNLDSLPISSIASQASSNARSIRCCAMAINAVIIAGTAISQKISWYIASLLLNKRNITNLLIIRNAGMKHMLGQRRADVAKASRGAAHFLAVRRDHPLGWRNAAGERGGNGNRDNYFVHRKLLLGKAALTTSNIKPLLENCKSEVT